MICTSGRDCHSPFYTYKNARVLIFHFLRELLITDCDCGSGEKQSICHFHRPGERLSFKQFLTIGEIPIRLTRIFTSLCWTPYSITLISDSLGRYVIDLFDFLLDFNVKIHCFRNNVFTHFFIYILF